MKILLITLLALTVTLSGCGGDSKQKPIGGTPLNAQVSYETGELLTSVQGTYRLVDDNDEFYWVFNGEWAYAYDYRGDEEDKGENCFTLQTFKMYERGGDLLMFAHSPYSFIASITHLDTTFLMGTNQFGIEAYQLSDLLRSDMEPLCQ